MIRHYKILIGLLTALTSIYAQASSTSLDIDMGAEWNCKIVNGQWTSVGNDVSIKLTSDHGTVSCPILSTTDKSNMPSAAIGWNSWRLDNIWARVSTSNATGTKGCTLFAYDMNGRLLGNIMVRAEDNKAKQSLRFTNKIIYDNLGSSALFYTLQCTLTRGSLLHGYKVSIKDVR